MADYDYLTQIRIRDLELPALYGHNKRNQEIPHLRSQIETQRYAKSSNPFKGPFRNPFASLPSYPTIFANVQKTRFKTGYIPAIFCWAFAALYFLSTYTLTTFEFLLKGIGGAFQWLEEKLVDRCLNADSFPKRFVYGVLFVLSFGVLAPLWIIGKCAEVSGDLLSYAKHFIASICSFFYKISSAIGNWFGVTKISEPTTIVFASAAWKNFKLLLISSICIAAAVLFFVPIVGQVAFGAGLLAAAFKAGSVIALLKCFAVFLGVSVACKASTNYIEGKSVWSKTPEWFKQTPLSKLARGVITLDNPAPPQNPNRVRGLSRVQREAAAASPTAAHSRRASSVRVSSSEPILSTRTQAGSPAALYSAHDIPKNAFSPKPTSAYTVPDTSSDDKAEDPLTLLEPLKPSNRRSSSFDQGTPYSGRSPENDDPTFAQLPPPPAKPDERHTDLTTQVSRTDTSTPDKTSTPEPQPKPQPPAQQPAEPQKGVGEPHYPVYQRFHMPPADKGLPPTSLVGPEKIRVGFNVIPENYVNSDGGLNVPERPRAGGISRDPNRRKTADLLGASMHKHKGPLADGNASQNNAAKSAAPAKTDAATAAPPADDKAPKPNTPS